MSEQSTCDRTAADAPEGQGRPGRSVVLSAESAASVRDAAKAVLYHGARYLPVLDDGTLVGVAVIRPRVAAPPGIRPTRPRAPEAAEQSR